jgi:hypothetical protein
MSDTGGVVVVEAAWQVISRPGDAASEQGLVCSSTQDLGLTPGV